MTLLVGLFGGEHVAPHLRGSENTKREKKRKEWNESSNIATGIRTVPEKAGNRYSKQCNLEGSHPTTLRCCPVLAFRATEWAGTEPMKKKIRTGWSAMAGHNQGNGGVFQA